MSSSHITKTTKRRFDPNPFDKPTTNPRMNDDPYVPGGGVQEFETCAKCISGNDEGEIYGCIRWTVVTGIQGRSHRGIVIDGTQIGRDGNYSPQQYDSSHTLPISSLESVKMDINRGINDLLNWKPGPTFTF